MHAQRAVLEEVRSVNTRVFGQAQELLRANMYWAQAALGISTGVAALLINIDTSRIRVFDVAVFHAEHHDDPEFWIQLVATKQAPRQTVADWHLKVIGQTLLHYARDVARLDTKICQCMLGVNRSVAEVFASIPIERALEIPYETSTRLFTIREGLDLEFWGRVANWPLSDAAKASVINHQLKMRAFAHIVDTDRFQSQNMKHVRTVATPPQLATGRAK